MPSGPGCGRSRRCAACRKVEAGIHPDLITVRRLEDDKGREGAILDIMAAEPEWAPGLPLKGAGFVCGYYQKD